MPFAVIVFSIPSSGASCGRCVGHRPHLLWERPAFWPCRASARADRTCALGVAGPKSCVRGWGLRSASLTADDASGRCAAMRGPVIPARRRAETGNAGAMRPRLSGRPDRVGPASFRYGHVRVRPQRGASEPPARHRAAGTVSKPPPVRRPRGGKRIAHPPFRLSITGVIASQPAPREPDPHYLGTGTRDCSHLPFCRGTALPEFQGVSVSHRYWAEREPRRRRDGRDASMEGRETAAPRPRGGGGTRRAVSPRRRAQPRHGTPRRT